MHYQVGIWNTLINLLDAINGQNISCGWAAKFIGTVGSATGNRQRINACLADKVRRFFGVS